MLVAILISIFFLALHLNVRPLPRSSDNALMTVIQLALLILYVCVLLIKSCNMSAMVCASYGFGDTASGELPTVTMTPRVLPQAASARRTALALLPLAGVYQFFVLFALILLICQLFVGVITMWMTGRVPKIFLICNAHMVSPGTIAQRVIVRR